MNEDLVKLLITITTTVAGLLLGLFKDEIKNIFISSKKSKYLLGKWICHWVENPTEPGAEPVKYDDVTEITSVRGRLLNGKGDANVGKWDFKGRIGIDTITLTYQVPGDHDRSGVIILQKLRENKRKLPGVWCQYKDGKIVTGTTEWIMPGQN